MSNSIPPYQPPPIRLPSQQYPVYNNNPRYMNGNNNNYINPGLNQNTNYRASQNACK